MNSKTVLKRTIKNLVLLLILPLFFMYWITSRGGRSDGTFQSYSQLLSMFPGRTGSYFRAAFYSLACPDTSDEVVIGFLTLLSHRDTTIKRGVYIGPQCNIGKCTIGEDTLIGSGVHVMSGNRQHNFNETIIPIQEQGGSYEKITIGADCWLGNGSIVMSTIGDHTVIAAGAIVTNPIPERVVAAGQPARIIRKR